ncbi:hypothetical protein LAZ67_23002401 [Cordylochernes scorpioides]|uniref:Zinc finger homeobox protein 4 n=1 Tax=Cordylochernes scorpioides TaxID=51811 RepID=A0ABY6LRN1_9ARAC|nr:hypothetical protein LAZ67_23002401 [Cordylochernes scorpioides]
MEADVPPRSTAMTPEERRSPRPATGEPSDTSSLSDAESIVGKIVYNPDGSAVLLEGESEASDEEPELPAASTASSAQGFLLNAFHITRNPAALYSALYGHLLQEKTKVPDVPVMHSYRVFTVRDKQKQQAFEEESTSKEVHSSEPGKRPQSTEKESFPILDFCPVPVKPVLMCFLCKLSFSYSKSFVAHAMGEHNITLVEEEKDFLSRKNCSAIIQGAGKDKEPLLSFLEPIPSSIYGGDQKMPRIFTQNSSPSSSSSLGTTFNSPVSSAVSRSNCGSSAITTLVSATTSPVSSLPELKGDFNSLLAGPSIVGNSELNEVLAPELEDLATIEKLAKAAAAEANDLSPRPLYSPKNDKSRGSSATPSGEPTTTEQETKQPLPPHFSNSLQLDRPPSRESTSPRTSPKANFTIPSPLNSSCQSPTPATSSPIGMCPLHPDGRPNGVECPKCDLVLMASRTLGGHMSMLHSRNSCKTLKCPKCNWHYKYQETLEIHMKEKHPENEMSCIYCLANQPHPRLARGETYTCGYKPYRCEVCNYSTTTKGNLSIHMQSDKHINNVQELQNGNIPHELLQQQQQQQQQQAQQQAQQQQAMPTLPDAVKKPPPPPPPASTKPKATWRCDVCNYETNVARNLRIHMTSEKHTHNMMVLQQNVKHMQQLTAFQQSQSMDSLYQFHPGLLLPCDTQLQPEAALADMAYNHALLMMATQQQQHQHQQQQQQRAMAAAMAAASKGLGTNFLPHHDIDSEASSRTEFPGDDYSNLFQCCICYVFSSDSLDALSHHVQQDRTRQREDEVLMAVAGNYICKLCTYKTNLKANFQLHCKTDKHLQRLQHFNHVKEGGPMAEWRLKYVNVSNPVQVRCNCCDYYTNSIHKLQMHMSTPRHEASCKLFLHLQMKESSFKADSKYFKCKLCNFNTRTKFNLIQHVHSLRHLQNENMRQIKDPDDTGDIFLVKEYNAKEKVPFDVDVGKFSPSIAGYNKDPTVMEVSAPQRSEDPVVKSETAAPMLKQALETNKMDDNDVEEVHTCSFCTFTCSSEAKLAEHAAAQHRQTRPLLLCPLCQDGFNDWKKLETHVLDIHHVNKEGVQKILSMVDQKDWLSAQNEKKNSQAAAAASTPSSKEPESTSQQQTGEPMEEGDKQADEASKITSAQDDSSESAADENCCPNCGALFNTIDELFIHQNEMGHLSLKQTPRGLGYLCWKKGCQQYFQNVVALQNHFRDVHAQSPPLSVSERHVYKYRCNQCSLAFKTMEKLQLHSQYHVIRAATQCVLCGRSFRSVSSLQKHVETSHTDMTKEEMEQYRNSLVNNPLLVGGSGGVLDPQTTELLKKESNREDAESLEERMDTSEEIEECTPEGEGDETALGEGAKENDSLEDYINSQAVAEDSYNDPNRKYKCHRCRLAFTRQSYLTSHNKTLLHRKGEKMSYPMEKYLDPNRPFKCEICMESFTQKNILLVHYNSVSHLHKLKQSMKEKEKENNSSTGNTTAASSAAPVPTLTTSIIISTSSSINKNDSNIISTTVSTSSSESATADKKPYKCNICKVAYSQGSTLDIHTRSVLHQTKASKLHELAITGQIDLSISLIERPDPNQDQADTSETPTSSSQNVASQVIGSSVPSPQVSEQVPGNPSATSASPILQVPSETSSSLQHSLGLVPPNPVQVAPQTSLSCQRCSAIFVSQEALIQHQQICCLFSQPPLINRSSAGSTVTANSITNSPFSSVRQEDFLSYPPQLDISSTKFPHLPSQLSPQFAQQLRAKCSLPRTRPLVYKHLLEGFGFDVVMQFNEFNQKHKKRDLPKDSETDSSSSKCAKPNEAVVKKEDNKEEDSKCNLPEINRSVCCLCQKEFSSIWVLKAHREEIHKEIVPVENVEKLGEDFRVDYEKRNPVQASSPGGHQDDLAYDTSSSSPLADQNLCSTPTSSLSSSLSLPMSMATSMTPPITSFSSQNADVSTVSASQMAAAQLQLNFLMMNMGHGMGLPMGMNMPYPAAAAAAMNLHPNLIPLIMAPPPLNPLMASAFNHSMVPGSVDPSFFAAQQQLLQQQSLAQAQQKRARTRISDDQLKILRTYFDINNSPTEEQLIEMSEKSGLPLKVIKHWFRNTLFKERQRNKDSPYNFNNPPSTFLNLEEYEKTGEAKVISAQNGTATSEAASGSTHQSAQNTYDMSSRLSSADETDSSQDGKFKMDSGSHYINSEDEGNEKSHLEFNLVPSSAESNMTQVIPSSPATSLHLPTSMESVVRSLESSPNSQPSLSLVSSSALAMPPLPYPPTSDSPMLGNAYNSCHSSGKRANRTRFTDYQIKVLQEFFESNAYPKDDDLEYLSKLLNLSPRVIVVWFQNARQKARKVYENQPPVTPEEENSGRFQRTPGLNYQCKKCLQVFQRYYELIKHQKNSCFKDENPLAVQIKNLPNNTETKAPTPAPAAPTSNSTPTPTAPAAVPDKIGQNGTFRCDKCGLVFSRYDLWREHQIVHIMNPNLFPNFSPNSSFGILQYEGQQSPPQAIKRKLSEDEESKEMTDQPRDKRLRTTILPEQLDYLYQKYQIESNPSRKMLENIAREVGLKKRVVQVWFQNTRARERKGQFRAHQQVIHKRCPFCRALFKARSALESHLATRHADQYTKGDIIIDALPDGDTDSNPETPNTTISEDTKSNPTFPSSIPPPSLSPNNQINFSNCNEAMKKYYEDSLKKYFNDLSGGGQNKESIGDGSSKPVKTATGEKGEIPLDLSKSVKMGFDGDSFLASFGDKSLDDLGRSLISEDARSETYSESTDNMEGDESNPTSPSPSLQSVKSQSQHQQQRSFYGAGKRYRTQMTTFQVKVMKSIFVDYKTPSMAECEMLGREIGLQKRVIQVWFQNARAKEKKSRLAFAKTFGQDIEATKPPEKCEICNIQYDAKFSNTSMQDHIFSKGHIANLRVHIEKMKKLVEGQDDRNDGTSTSSSADPPNLMQQLQMMGFQQMAGLQLPTGYNNNNNPPPSLVKEDKVAEASKKDEKKKDASPHGMQDFPSSDAASSGIFPYMYAAAGGYPGYFPGPFFHPPMYQGRDNL